VTLVDVWMHDFLLGKSFHKFCLLWLRFLTAVTNISQYHAQITSLTSEEDTAGLCVRKRYEKLWFVMRGYTDQERLEKETQLTGHLDDPGVNV